MPTFNRLIPFQSSPQSDSPRSQLRFDVKLVILQPQQQVIVAALMVVLRPLLPISFHSRRP